tara:strand:- start:1520 stop:3037 length:1518 start_codon:yes stop_codon:yes gene_type:complete
MAKLVVEESPLSSFLGDLPSILFQYNERRLSEQRQDMKLTEAREYEQEKLIELREYQDKVRDQQTQSNLVNLLAQDARTDTQTALSDYNDVQDMYMETLGKLPDRSDAVNEVLKAGYGSQAENINDYISLQDYKANALNEASQLIKSNMNTLTKEANEFISENTVDFYNLNFPDQVLDEEEFKLMSKQFVKGMRIKGLDDKASENLMKAAYYQTPYEDRVKEMQENVKAQIEKKTGSASNYMTMLAGAFSDDSDDKNNIIRALGGGDVGKQRYESIFSAMASSPADAYRILETTQFDNNQYGSEFLKDLSENQSIKLATRQTIGAFLDSMEEIELLTNPIGGGTISQMERLVDGMETTDLKEPINKLLGIVGSYDEIVQADHYDALGRIMIDRGLVTQEGYDELLKQVLSDDNSQVFDEILDEGTEILNTLKVEMEGEETEIEKFNDVLNTLKNIDNLRKSGEEYSEDKAMQLLEDLRSRQITDDNQDQLDIEDFTFSSLIQGSY